MMRLLVCGDRGWTDRDLIMMALSEIKDEVAVVIEGGANGADSLARDVADELKIPVKEYPADWEKHHRAAGPIRNKRMLIEGKPDMVLAFHDDISRSKGTKSMLNLARAAGVECRVIGHGRRGI